ncbi:hypothetical protein N752_17665 [Desulforamulus aquiferis]|nr:hypothetical protein N752_17665 [Desulforamulus aquiferis]
MQGLDNVIRAYKPGVIGILTTCLAETIGEDIDRIAQDYLAERGIKDFPIVTVGSPGYGGTHTEGYWLAAKRIVAKMAAKTPGHGKVNIIIPNISPADIRELKRILQLMQVDFTLFPDFSDTLDRPYERPYQKLPKGGTRLADIAAMPGAKATIQMGLTVDDSMSPGKYLETEFGVPLYNLPIPMGVENTDLFVNLLKEISGNPIPDSLNQERGRLLDCMIDSHKYNAQGSSVIFGEPENVFSVVKTCIENGVYPVVVATGSKNPRLAKMLQSLTQDTPEGFEILNEADFTSIRKLAREKQANIAIGHSDGRYLTEREGIPLVRMGFPIHDRTGGQRILSVGYTGTTMFLDRITNTLLEAKHAKYRRSMYEQFYQGTGETQQCCIESCGDQHAMLQSEIRQ